MFRTRETTSSCRMANESNAPFRWCLVDPTHNVTPAAVLNVLYMLHQIAVVIYVVGVHLGSSEQCCLHCSYQ